jgi:hypothetical protein
MRCCDKHRQNLAESRLPSGAYKGKHAEAIEQYRKAIELEPDCAEACLDWGCLKRHSTVARSNMAVTAQNLRNEELSKRSTPSTAGKLKKGDLDLV